MTTKRVFALLLLAALAACNVGDGGTAGSEAGIVVGPQAVMLAGAGATRTLDAEVSGVEGPPVWTSSDPTVVSVDEAGRVTAVGPVGTARITAAIGDLKSEPVYVYVATPVAGAVLLTDSQIVSGPSAVDPLAEPAPENPYEVVLRGVAGVSVGSILVNTEALPVGGRVVGVEPEGSDLRVRLVSVPPGELFTDFAFRDTIDLSGMPVEIPADLAALYDIDRVGNTLIFTPMFTPGASLASAQGTYATFQPFTECKVTVGSTSGSTFPLDLSVAPAFELSLEVTVEREITPAGTKLIVRGEPTFKINAQFDVKAAFQAKLECKTTLAFLKLPAPGLLGLFLGSEVDFGVGFEVGGKITLVSAKIGATAKLKTTIEAGVVCPAGGNCEFVGNVTTSAEFAPKLEAPALTDAQLEPSVKLFGFLKLKAGNLLVNALKFDAIEVKAGGELGARLTLEALQMEDEDPKDGRSSYALAFKAEAGPGIKLGKLLKYLGLSEVVPLKLSFEVPLGESPTGSVTADQAQYQPAEPVTLVVKLSPDSTMFPLGLFYNVDRVVILRRTGALTTEAIAEQVATDGQTEFTFTFDSPDLLTAGEFFAFVVTKLLPLDPPKLEIGAARAPPVTLSKVEDEGELVDSFVQSGVECDNDQYDREPITGPGFYATSLACSESSNGVVEHAESDASADVSLDPQTGELHVHVKATLTGERGTATLLAKVAFTIHEGTYDFLLAGTLTGQAFVHMPSIGVYYVETEGGVLQLNEPALLGPGEYEFMIYGGESGSFAVEDGTATWTQGQSTIDVHCSLLPAAE